MKTAEFELSDLLLWSQQFPGTPWNLQQFPHLRGPSICHGLRPVIINPPQKKTETFSPPATHKDKASIKGTFVMTRRWQTMHLVWNQFAIRKISPHTYITGSTWSKCLESSQFLVLISLTLLNVCLSMYNIILIWYIMISFLLPSSRKVTDKVSQFFVMQWSRREKEG